MSTLHDRINRVINTTAFEHVLERHGIDLIEFQCTWDKVSEGKFEKLPPAYQEAILAGESDISGCREVALA
jgi:hypothetical protein